MLFHPHLIQRTLKVAFGSYGYIYFSTFLSGMWQPSERPQRSKILLRPVPQSVQQPQLCAKIDAAAPNQSDSHAEPSDFSTIPFDR